MKTSIRLFVAVVWVMVALFAVSGCFDLMNMASTIALCTGILGLLLIIILSIKTRLGINLIKQKTKTKK